uniref:Uncharacterized protein n=1 Tax=Utricularia reniformis TaxID=192314 RepID=A0A1Y0AZ13_9LAMI|nr:hypothetical protein AEK19_MT1588 [Utricularia reniformis]ART30391.1 hypothetical protein AEK19_MT1588 [Utricularia reniformis]
MVINRGINSSTRYGPHTHCALTLIPYLHTPASTPSSQQRNRVGLIISQNQGSRFQFIHKEWVLDSGFDWPTIFFRDSYSISKTCLRTVSKDGKLEP